jgi:hypothetical protein
VPYLIGTDEAGYGPNLGPLTIGATVWEIPGKLRCADLFDALSSVIASALPPRDQQDADRRVVVADSKLVYQAGGGLRHLERGVLAMLGTLGRRPRRWSDIWLTLAPRSDDCLPAIPWHDGFDVPLPVDNAAEDVDRLPALLCDAFQATGIRLVDFRSRAIFPAEFNEAVDRLDSKGAALSRWTLTLVHEMLSTLPLGSTSVFCDKHGGRDYYAGLLSDTFEVGLLNVVREGPKESVYRFRWAERAMEFRFAMKGECYLPVALASMGAKYLRELTMLAFNRFWCDRMPGLLPTAGYPQDAPRFKTAIAPLQDQLGIADHLLWRRR